MSPITAILRSIKNNKKTYVWKPENTRVKWFSWETYSHIEFDTGIVYAVDFDKTITSATLSDIDQWWNVIRNTDINLKRVNITNAVLTLQKSIKETKENQNWFTGSTHQKSKDISIIITFSLTTLLGVLIYLKLMRNRCIKNAKNSLNSKQNDNTTDETETPIVRNFELNKRSSVRVSWREPLQDQDDSIHTEERVEEITTKDIEKSAGSQISLNFFTKPLKD